MKEREEAFDRFQEKQSSGEGDGPIKVTNPSMTREEAIKKLGLEKDPAKEGVDEALRKLKAE